MKVNSITGTIIKNYQRSFFKRFKLDSDLAKQLFDEENPHLSKFTTEYFGEKDSRGYKKEDKRPVVIIQMMMCGDREVIAEIMWKDDFNELSCNIPMQD